MLSERTNILLDRQTRGLLSSIAAKENISVGELIRRAIDKVYKNRDDEIIKKRTRAVQAIYKLQKKIKPTRGIDYRELIEYGRYR